MYRFIHPMPYEWSVVRTGTFVNPYFTCTLQGKIRLKWVELLDADEQSWGCWHESSMPHELIAAFARDIQEWKSEWEYLPPGRLIGLQFDISDEPPK